MIKKCVDKGIKIIGFKIGSEPEQSCNKCKEIYDRYKSLVKDEGQLFEIYNFVRGSTSEVSKTFKDMVVKAATCAAPKK